MMVRQAHQQQCDDLNSVTEHSRSMPNGDAMSLPNGWETKEIGDVLSLEYGKPLPKEKRTPNGLYPVYGANGIKDRTNEFYVEEPSIIVGRKGSAGEINYTEDKFWPLDVTYFTKFDKSELNLDFLFHLLTLLELPKLAKGVKPGINRNDVYAIKTKIPPLDEQKRIVAKLDECFEAIHIARTNVEKNLSNAKELFQSQLNQIFASTGSATDGDSPELAEGWVEKKLGDITTILGDGLHGTPKYTIDGEYYFINGNNLDNGKIIYKNRTKRASFGEYEKYKKNLNDRTVFVSINGTLGNVAFYNNEKVILGKSACYFNLTEQADKNFIKYVILSPYFIDYAHKVATGATIKNVSLKSMRELKINLPKIEEQKEIVILLDTLQSQTQSLESNYQQELEALDELKKSILQKAFRGELTIDNG